VGELGVPRLFLIKPYMWGRTTRTESTRSAPPLSLVSFTAAGPHTTGTHPLPCCYHFFSAERNFFRENKPKNGKALKRRRNLTNNIPLESPWRVESIETIYFEDGALYITRVRGEVIRV
jgi:hypothetical protein